MFNIEIQRFLIVAELLNITAAADSLYISQSGLSKQISKIEEALNVQLFKRSLHSLELTPAGQKFYVSAKRFISECNQLSSENNPNESYPNITIGVPPHYGHFGNDIALSFFDKYLDSNNYNLYIKQIPYSNMLLQLQMRNVDYVLAPKNVTESWNQIEKMIIQRRVFKVIVNAQHRLANKGIINIRDLKKEPFISINREYSKLSYDRAGILCGFYDFYPNYVFNTENFDLMYAMISLGQGMAFSSMHPNKLLTPDIVAINIDTSDEHGKKIKKLLSHNLVAVWNSSYSPVFKKR